MIPKLLHYPRTRPQNTMLKVVLAGCFLSMLGAATGCAAQAQAQPKAQAGVPTQLRSTQGAALANRATTTMNANNASLPANISPQAWLGDSIWRAGPCQSAQNFQTFRFTNAPKVEVGSGKPGDGEQLELLHINMVAGGLIQIETRVCAPVGCNQTMERYKKLNADQMQEWHFEGRLPDRPPYVIVANGLALDGSGPGRIFTRCTS